MTPSNFRFSLVGLVGNDRHENGTCVAYYDWWSAKCVVSTNNCKDESIRPYIWLTNGDCQCVCENAGTNTVQLRANWPV